MSFGMTNGQGDSPFTRSLYQSAEPDRAERSNHQPSRGRPRQDEPEGSDADDAASICSKGLTMPT